MKVVKTHPTWKLYQRGYKVAFRFQENGIVTIAHPYYKVMMWLKENRSPEALLPQHDENEKYRWTVHVGRAKSWREATPYFIGLKDEADVSAVLLSIGDKL